MNRMQRLDDGFERRVEKLIPPSWGVRRRAPWGGLIGVGVAVIAVNAVLLPVALLAGNDGFIPAINLSLGMVAVPLGIALNRRWHRRHDE